ncbi:hypothetical protein AGMMS49941_12710 [Deferribacterales bacterium]|nr:hypothetical protein AGMMS49941_12710 [Deferribacterales bacterium]
MTNYADSGSLYIGKQLNAAGGIVGKWNSLSYTGDNDTTFLYSFLDDTGVLNNGIRIQQLGAIIKSDEVLYDGKTGVTTFAGAVDMTIDGKKE